MRVRGVIACALTCACGGGGAIPPELDVGAMEPRVRKVLSAARDRVVAERTAESWAHLGFLLDAHQLLPEAEECLGRAVELDPGGFEHVYMYAFLADLLGRDADTIDARFREAVALRPDYAPVHLRRATALSQVGRFEGARASYAAALAVRADYGRAHSGLGQLLVTIGDPDAALPHLERAHAAAPDDRPTAAALAQAYALLGRAGEARAKSAHARGLEGATLPHEDPVRRSVLDLAVSSWASFQRARRRADDGQFDAAIADLGIVVEARPDAYEVRVELARLCMARGQRARARTELEAALVSRPDHAGAHDLLGQLDVEEERFLEGIAHLERASAAGALDATSHMAWGVALARLERYDEAVVRFENVLLSRPRDVECLYRQALAYELGGHVGEAIDVYRRAIALKPEHPLAARLAPLLRR